MIAELIQWTLRKRETKAPKTHNYTNRGWGHDYCIMEIVNGGQKIKISGWGMGIEAGDFILIQNNNPEPGANPDTRYQFDSIEYEDDPRDMWFGTASFAPRS